MFDVIECDNLILSETKQTQFCLHCFAWVGFLGGWGSIKLVFSSNLLKRFLQHLLFTLEGDQKESEASFVASVGSPRPPLRGTAAAEEEEEEKGLPKNADDDV